MKNALCALLLLPILLFAPPAHSAKQTASLSAAQSSAALQPMPAAMASVGARYRYPPPETIRMIDMHSKKVTHKQYDNIPEALSLVFRKQGRRVASIEEADEIIPVAEVQLYFYDRSGDLVPRPKGLTARLVQVDKHGNILQSTLLKGQ